MFRDDDTDRPSSADRVTCCSWCISAASTRLWVGYLVPAPTVGGRWRPGGGPVCARGLSCNLLKLKHLCVKSCVLRVDNECVCDQLVHAADGAVALFRGGFLQS